MKAFLMAQGLWGGYILGQADRGYLSKKEELKKLPKEHIKEIHAKQEAWDKIDNMALGHMMLRLTPIIQQNFTTSAITMDL